jgi:hypothetical protein
MIAPTNINWGMDAPVLADVLANSSTEPGIYSERMSAFQHVDHDYNPQGGEQGFRVNLFYRGCALIHFFPFLNTLDEFP